MACIEEGEGLGLGLSQDGASVAGRHPIIKQPSISPVASQDSGAPFSHHRSPSWVRSQQPNFEAALPSPVPEEPLSPRQRAPNSPFLVEQSLNVGQISVESNYIDQLESYESGVSPKSRNYSNSSFTSTLSQIKKVGQRVRKDSFKKSNSFRNDSVTTAMSMSNDDPLQNIHDTTKFTNTPTRNRAAMECMYSEGISPRTRISQSSTISTRSSSKSVDEIAKRRSDLAGIQQTDFTTLDSFNGLPYARDTTTADLFSLNGGPSSPTKPESQQSTPTEKVSFNPSLALLMAEEGRDVRVEANGRPLSEIEPLITSRTTHLILSNCHDTDILEYLERVLPIVSHSLVVLDVSYCQLNELPQGLSQCTRLEELNLSGNHFLYSWHTDADALVRFYSTLQVLLIDQCALTILPGVLMHFRQLRSLSARGNHLTHLPAWLHHLRKLERISIGENPFVGAWIDICLPFTTAVVYTSAASDLEYSVRLAADVSANENILGRPRSQSYSPGMLSQFNFSTSNSMTRNDEVLEELEDEDQSTEDQQFERTISSSAAQYVNKVSKHKVRPTLSTSDLKSLSDLEISSVISTPSTDASPATPSSIASSPSSIRKSSVGDADISKWLTFRRKKVIRKASSTVLVVQPESLSVSPSQSTTSLALQEKEKKKKRSSSKHKSSRPKTSGSATPPERTSSLSARTSYAALSSSGKGTDDDSSSLGSKSDQSSPRTQKQLHRTSFLPFALPIDPDARTAIDADIHQRHNVRILLEYLEDLSLLNPDQRRLNEWIDRPRSESISSQGSSAYMPALSRSGSETASSISVSTRPSSDDDSQSKITTCASPMSIREKKDSTSISQPEIQLAPAIIKDDAIRRANIIAEIIATEQTYVKTLGELIDIYVLPSTKVDAHNQPQIPISERRIVFGNVEAIQHFHSQAFLPSLCSAAQVLLDKKGERPDANDAEAMEAFRVLTAQVAESIAQTFERHVAFFRMYTAYVNSVESGQARVASWLSTTTPSSPYLRAGYSMSNLRKEAGMMTKSFDTLQHNSLGVGKHEIESHALQTKDRKRIKTFLQRARLDKNHSQISLEAYLHLPVQRVPRYRLLFEDLVKCCPSERLKDGRSIINALGSINSIATMMNESKRQCEMNRRLLKWQERIRGTFPSPLVQPHRRLLHDGSLILTRIVTRIPSFTARRITILGDTTTYELMEDPTLLQIADAEHIITQSKAEEDQFRGHKQYQSSNDSLQSLLPPPLPPKDHKDALLQVHHLEQRFVSTAVEVILCNDILVILEASFPNGGITSALTLFTVMRIEGEARLVDEKTLRICDSEKIYYLTAKSKKEAEEWQRSFSVATRRPSI